MQGSIALLTYDLWCRMFAIIRAGGKQYKVQKGDKLLIERLYVDAGSKLEFDHVLAIGDETSSMIGAPYVEGASVGVNVLEHTRGEKVIIFKKNRRHNYRRKNGHRQDLTRIEVSSIVGSGAKKKAKAETVDVVAEAAEPAKKAAPRAKAKAKSTSEE